MADKLTPLILDALARAAADPTGTPLYATKTEPGLFPITAAAKPAAQKGVTEGYFHVVRTDLKGKQTRELYAATEKGLKFLIDQASPRQVLEDFVRLLEERNGEVADLLAAATRMAESLNGLKAVVAEVLPKVEVGRIERPSVPDPVSRGRGVFLSAPLTVGELSDLVHNRLQDWSSSAGVSRDCPLPDLFASLSTLEPAPTVGQFHDALRQLHATGRVYLHPWTGPLYALPEPALALLVGHEIAYYASVRTAVGSEMSVRDRLTMPTTDGTR